MSQQQKFQSVKVMRILIVVSCVIATLAGGVSVYLTTHLSANSQRQAEISAAALDAQAIYAEGLQMCQATRNILLDPANPTAHRNFGTAQDAFLGTLSSLETRVQQQMAQSELPDKLLAIRKGYQQHVQVQRRIHQLAIEGSFEAAKAVLNKEDTPLWRKYKEQILESRVALVAEAQKVNTECQLWMVAGRWTSWISGILVLAVSGFALSISLGVCHRLRRVMSELTEGARQVAAAASQLSDSSQGLATGAAQQAAALQQTSSSAEQVNAMVQRNGENTVEAVKLVAHTDDQLQRANQALSEAVQSIRDMNEASERIARIIQVIDEIAFQTNILALNAAVEASRAGEAGMGFAVVADEVRNLAQRSAEAARDSGSLIEDSIRRSRESRQKVQAVADAVHKMGSEVNNIDDLLKTVATASKEQRTGMQQISKAVSHMSQLTQSAAASAEQGASASTQLDSQAQGMLLLIDELSIAVAGSVQGSEQGAM